MTRVVGSRWPFLLFGLAACTSEEAVRAKLAACEPVEAGVRTLWREDLRAPCGEEWLLEHAPRRMQPPSSPLGRARFALRALLHNEPLDDDQSLDLGRTAGLPSDVAQVHRELLAEEPLPAGFGDPWLVAWHGLKNDESEAASRLVAWSIFDPNAERRSAVLEDVALRFGLEASCDDPLCLWDLADELAGEAGPVGRRDALSDSLWLDTHPPRVVGAAGDWVGAWRDWADVKAEHRRLVRWGVGDEPASALWIGGNERGRMLLEAELGYVDASEVAAGLPPGPKASDTAGGRAAALVPWSVSPGGG